MLAGQYVQEYDQKPRQTSQERCPNLENFDVERPQDNTQADAVMRLLTATPTIRRLTIGSNTWCTRCDMKEGTAKKAFYYPFTLLAGHIPLQDLSWVMLMYLPRLRLLACFHLWQDAATCEISRSITGTHVQSQPASRLKNSWILPEGVTVLNV